MTDNSPFRFIQSILQTKKYEMNTDQDEKDFSLFFTNLGLSQHLDTILYCNEVNKNWQSLTNRMAYDYLFYSIRKTFRKYGKWAKKFKDEDIEMIKEYYQISKGKAEEYLSILSKEQLDLIKKDMEKGTVS